MKGLVVGDFQASGQLGGISPQDTDGDGDQATSDGVFSHALGVPDVAAADLVRVTGRVDEY